KTQMQSAADALALAGAAELDRRPGAITRATAAINNLLNNQLFGMEVTPAILPDSSGIIFYQALPEASQPLSAGTVTTNDLQARYVAVTLIPKPVQTIFPVSYLQSGGTNTFSTGATAVAGRDLLTCQQTPMWICNPFETAGMTYAQATAALEASSSLGRFMQLQLADNAQYGPGNFGWVRPNFDTLPGKCGSNGGSGLVQTVSRSHPQQCFSVSGIDTQTGNISNANDGINTRFDLYSGPFNSCKNNPEYAPASNVRKGVIPGNNACNPPNQNPIL